MAYAGWAVRHPFHARPMFQSAYVYDVPQREGNQRALDSHAELLQYKPIRDTGLQSGLRHDKDPRGHMLIEGRMHTRAINQQHPHVLFPQYGRNLDPVIFSIPGQGLVPLHIQMVRFMMMIPPIDTTSVRRTAVIRVLLSLPCSSVHRKTMVSPLRKSHIRLCCDVGPDCVRSEKPRMSLDDT